MKTFHLFSWSEEARIMADHIIYYYERGDMTVEELKEFFGNSLLEPIIRQRGAKRICRYLRKRGVK